MWLMPIAALVEALMTVNVMLSIGFIPPLVVFLVVLVAIAVLGFARPGSQGVPDRRHRVAPVRRAEPPVRHRRAHRPDRDKPRLDRHHRHRRGHHGRDRRDRGVRGAAASPARGSRPECSARGSSWPSSSWGSSSGPAMSRSGVTAHWKGRPVSGWPMAWWRHPSRRPSSSTRSIRRSRQKALQLRTGPGTVYVVNADAGPHTFDIELNGRVLSYPVPGPIHDGGRARPGAAGRYTYWCAIPGHRSSMEGTLEVTE